MAGIIDQIAKAVLGQLAFPRIVRVTHSEAGERGYYIDGEAVTPGSYESTGELFKEIPVPPVWADGDGRGVFIPPTKGQMVVVSFVEGNKAYPFVAGVYGEEYRPVDNASAGQIAICDASGLRIELAADGGLSISCNGKMCMTMDTAGKCEIKDDKGAVMLIDSSKLKVGNSTGTVKTLLEQILDIISGLQTTGTGNMGSPVVSSVLPSVTAQCAAAKAAVGQVFGG